MENFEYCPTYTFRGQEYEMSELYFDVPCYYDNDPNHDPKETNAKYRFIADVYLKEKIVEFIKHPPACSGFETEWKEYEHSSIEYASLKYVYKRHIKSHHEYARTLDKLFTDRKFSRDCSKDFNNEYRKHKIKQTDEQQILNI